MSQQSTLIIGCGHLGSRVLQKLGRNSCRIWLTNRNRPKSVFKQDAEITALLFDINKPETWKNLQVCSTEILKIFFLLPPTHIDLRLLREFVSLIKSWRIQRLVMSSSTVVYGTDSRCVDANSKVHIDNPRAEKQFAVEQCFSDAELELRIVRLAGLYAADRIIGRKAISEGQKLSGKGESWLNLIHTVDAADLIIEIMQGETASLVELGCDGKPVRRIAYYSDLAEHLNCRPPVFCDDQTERGGGRQCDNRITIERTGWRPAIIDYRKGWSLY